MGQLAKLRADRQSALPGSPIVSITHPPTRISAAIFAAKAALLRIRRACTNAVSGIHRHPHANPADFPIVLAESHTPLWPEEKLEERAYQLGKVHNLRCALRLLHRATAPAGATFSFWKQVQRTTRRRGYVAGRMLQQGCLVPSIGGGLCQLSNALYDDCLQADCEILERHAHSSVVPGSAAAIGRDATVAWNYVDLRFRPRQPMLVEALLTKDEVDRPSARPDARRSSGQRNGSLRPGKAHPADVDPCRR